MITTVHHQAACLIMQLCNIHLTFSYKLSQKFGNILKDLSCLYFQIQIKKKISFKESFLLHMKFCAWLRHSRLELINFHFILIIASTCTYYWLILYMHVYWFCGIFFHFWNLTVAYKDGHLSQWLIYVVILDK